MANNRFDFHPFEFLPQEVLYSMINANNSDLGSLIDLSSLSRVSKHFYKTLEIQKEFANYLLHFVLKGRAEKARFIYSRKPYLMFLEDTGQEYAAGIDAEGKDYFRNFTGSPFQAAWATGDLWTVDDMLRVIDSKKIANYFLEQNRMQNFLKSKHTETYNLDSKQKNIFAVALKQYERQFPSKESPSQYQYQGLVDAIYHDDLLKTIGEPNKFTQEELQKIRSHFLPQSHVGPCFDGSEMIAAYRIANENFSSWNNNQQLFFLINIIGLIGRLLSAVDAQALCSKFIEGINSPWYNPILYRHFNLDEFNLNYFPLNMNDSYRMGIHFAIVHVDFPTIDNNLEHLIAYLSLDQCEWNLSKYFEIKNSFSLELEKILKNKNKQRNLIDSLARVNKKLEECELNNKLLNRRLHKEKEKIETQLNKTKHVRRGQHIYKYFAFSDVERELGKDREREEKKNKRENLKREREENKNKVKREREENKNKKQNLKREREENKNKRKNVKRQKINHPDNHPNLVSMQQIPPYVPQQIYVSPEPYVPPQPYIPPPQTYVPPQPNIPPPQLYVSPQPYVHQEEQNYPNQPITTLTPQVIFKEHSQLLQKQSFLFFQRQIPNTSNFQEKEKVEESQMTNQESKNSLMTQTSLNFYHKGDDDDHDTFAEGFEEAYYNDYSSSNSLG